MVDGRTMESEYAVLDCLPATKPEYADMEIGRNHYRKDLKPFPCLSESCEDSRPRFESREDWRHHMDSKHSTDWPQQVHKQSMWVCDDPHHKDECNDHNIHALNQFSSSAELDNHKRLHHGGNQPSPMPSQCDGEGKGVCPLCCFAIEECETRNHARSKKSNDSKSKAKPSSLSLPWQHIAAHLQFVMVVCLRLQEVFGLDYKEDADQNSVSINPDGADTSDETHSDYQDLLAKGEEDEIQQQSSEPSPTAYRDHPPESQQRRSLRDEIEAKMILQDNFNLCFVPESALEQLFREQDVQVALEKHKPLLKIDISRLVSFVRKKAIKVFAILIWGEVENLIEQFYQHDFGDEHLPIHYRFNDAENCIEAFSYRLGNLSIIDNHPFNHDQWTYRTLNHFCNHDQWLFLSPVFRANKFRYEFHEKSRMPFVDGECKVRKVARFSMVEEWRIHHDHLQVGGSIVWNRLCHQNLA
jgi:hypothetical protein